MLSREAEFDWKGLRCIRIYLPMNVYSPLARASEFDPKTLIISRYCEEKFVLKNNSFSHKCNFRN